MSYINRPHYAEAVEGTIAALISALMVGTVAAAFTALF